MYRKYRIVDNIASSVSQYESYRDQVYRYTPTSVYFIWLIKDIFTPIQRGTRLLCNKILFPKLRPDLASSFCLTYSIVTEC